MRSDKTALVLFVDELDKLKAAEGQRSDKGIIAGFKLPNLTG
jgi:hypothetical protein